MVHPVTTYKEDIYPAEMTVTVADIWVFAPWIKRNKKKYWKRPFDMPVMIFVWVGNSPTIIAMSHQSLQ